MNRRQFLLAAGGLACAVAWRHWPDALDLAYATNLRAIMANISPQVFETRSLFERL